MAAEFVAASSMYLQNAGATLAMPFTMACWVRPTNTGAIQTWFNVSDTATANNYWLVGKSGTEQFRVVAAAGGVGNATNLATTFTANLWHFVLVRIISATSRRLSAVNASGLIEHAQGTTSRNPTGIDSISVGAQRVNSTLLPMDGSIGEFWYTDTDIQPDGAQLENALLMKLAFGGPFSVPHVAQSLVEYRSFRSGLESTQDRPEEIYYRGLRPTWTNTNGVNLGPHPPLPGWYQRPGGIITRPALV